MDLQTEHDIYPGEQEASKRGKRKRQENDAPDIRKFRRVRTVESSAFTGSNPKYRRSVGVIMLTRSATSDASYAH